MPKPVPPPDHFWEGLFAAGAGGAGGLRVEMRVLSKRGRPFLLVPRLPRAAAVALELYPAQTVRARAAGTVLRWLLRAGVPLGTKGVTFSVDPGDAFAAFLALQAAEPKGRLPMLGILAGNPASDGQRFLLLVFDACQRPVAVVKAGLSARARFLVGKEESFLAAVPRTASCIPRLRAKFESGRLRAMSLDFFAGDSPRPHHEGALPGLLASWVDRERATAVSASPDWVRLEDAAPPGGLFTQIVRRLGGRTVHPAIQHGDLAPWNIKVSAAGDWTVLDWERGQLDGIPGWDWFHYVIQPGILVERLSTADLVQRIETLLGEEVFAAYAGRAGINGCERELLLAYLLHAVEVIKPSEGLDATRELLEALAVRWRVTRA